MKTLCNNNIKVHTGLYVHVVHFLMLEVLTPLYYGQNQIAD